MNWTTNGLYMDSDKIIEKRCAYGGNSVSSSKNYLDFVLEQLSEMDGITYRAMMGEYIIYYRGKVIGGIYDDRFLVKPVRSVLTMMPNADRELP